MKIPFDVKFRPQIESGEYKVFLANGNTVRILAWDLPGDYPIAAEDWPLNDETDTRVETYTEDGWDGIGEKTYDLFLVTPEPELSEFEHEIENLLNLADGEGHARTTIENTKKVAKKLLELAKKEWNYF